MLSDWIDRLTNHLESGTDDERRVADLESVSAQLLVEVARADQRIDASERAAIRDALRRAFSLDAGEIDAIVDRALAGADELTSLHATVGVVNDRFDKADKLRLLEQMWRVAMADGDLDKYEEYTIRKIADLLYLKHRDYMQVKLRVVEGGVPAPRQD